MSWYLVEFRLHGYVKDKLRELTEAISKNFDIQSKRMIPHVTIAGPLYTDDEKKLVKVVYDVVKKYDLVGFRLDGFGRFSDRAIHVNIMPSKELIMMRENIIKKLKKFCVLAEHDYESSFKPHVTLLLNTSISYKRGGVQHTFGRVMEFLDSWKIPEFVLFVPRVTILGRGRRILCEYDLMLKRILTRREALDRMLLRRTIEMLRNKQRSLEIVNGRMRFDPVDEDNYLGKIFVVSDMHFDHTNIIEFCNRPFRSVDDMNSVLRSNWNRVVRYGDRVYYLGDLTYGRGRRSIDYWLSQLNGEIRFIRGNHDTDIVTKAEVIEDKFYIRYKSHDFLLMHSPYRPVHWDGWIIHGDKHNNDLILYPHINKKNKTINVCVEITRYSPISLDEIISKISE